MTKTILIVGGNPLVGASALVETVRLTAKLDSNMDKKTLDEIALQEKTYKITNASPPIIDKSLKTTSRRERRAKERKLKKRK